MTFIIIILTLWLIIYGPDVYAAYRLRRMSKKNLDDLYRANYVDDMFDS